MKDICKIYKYGRKYYKSVFYRRESVFKLRAIALIDRQSNKLVVCE